MSWEAVPGVQIRWSGLVEQGHAKSHTEATCKAACELQATCQRIDFDIVYGTCLLADSGHRRLFPDSNVKHYHLIRISGKQYFIS